MVAEALPTKHAEMSRLLALEQHVDGRRLEGQRAKLHGGRHVCRRGDRDVATSRRSRHFPRTAEQCRFRKQFETFQNGVDGRQRLAPTKWIKMVPKCAVSPRFGTFLF